MKKIVLILLVNIFCISWVQAYTQWIWIWNNVDIDKKEGVVKNLQADNFNRIYIQFDISRPKDDYKRFVSYLKKSGIDVYVLDGNSRWVFESEQKWLVYLIQWFHEYQSVAQEDEKFAWIRLDIEPWTLSEWNTDKENMILKYQNVISRIKNNLLNEREYIWLDIPFWFDETSYDNVYWKWILYDWLTSHVHELTLMAYRNTFDGSNGIKGLTLYEVEHHRKNSKYQLNIGVETLKSAEWPNISFSTVWYDKMLTELHQLIPYMKENSVWLDIHNYRSFLELKWGSKISLQEEKKVLEPQQKEMKVSHISPDMKDVNAEQWNPSDFWGRCKIFIENIIRIVLAWF